MTEQAASLVAGGSYSRPRRLLLRQIIFEIFGLEGLTQQLFLGAIDRPGTAEQVPLGQLGQRIAVVLSALGGRHPDKAAAGSLFLA
jgi:hypothetical protein